MNAPENLTFNELDRAPSRMCEDVLEGLRNSPKSLPSYLLYDARGSQLFDKICELDEYYLTEAECSILEANAKEIASLIGSPSLLIEYGSGNARKIRILLRELSGGVTYIPVDISREFLLENSQKLAREFPKVAINAFCADFHTGLSYGQLKSFPPRRALFFPGSTIANYAPDKAVRLMRQIRELLGEAGVMIVGVDLKKESAIISRAYNDSKGVTAEFELNALVRLNRELGANFDVSAFFYHGFYNLPENRVEMYLVSQKPQIVRILGETFSFSKGETIHVEDSYKYTVKQFQELAQSAGLTPGRVWCDSKRLFSVHLLLCPGVSLALL